LTVKPLGLFDQLILLKRPLQQGPHDAGLHGLFEEPESLKIVDEGNSLVDAAESRQDDSWSAISPLGQDFKKRDAVHPRHHQVGQDRISGKGAKLGESVLAIGRRGDLIAE
jgi:hypothetical protein